MGSSLAKTALVSRKLLTSMDMATGSFFRGSRGVSETAGALAAAFGPQDGAENRRVAFSAHFSQLISRITIAA